MTFVVTVHNFCVFKQFLDRFAKNIFDEIVLLVLPLNSKRLLLNCLIYFFLAKMLVKFFKF